jgi:hypothetical protein
MEASGIMLTSMVSTKALGGIVSVKRVPSAPVASSVPPSGPITAEAAWLSSSEVVTRMGFVFGSTA